MKVALYARVSDDKKKSDGERRQDVERQITLVSHYLKAKGVTEFEKYVDDGKSAYTDDFNQRTEFKRLLNDCRRFFVREIYIEDMTRLSRNLLQGLQWLKELGVLGVHLVSLREGEIEVTSSKGWLQNSLLLMFAEWESRIRSEKVKSGMQKAKNLGKSIGRIKGGKKPSRFYIEKEIPSGANL